MARPEKHIVDFYPKKIKNGKTLFILESKYQIKGYGFFYKLLDFLANTPDHYFQIKSDTDVLYLSGICLIQDEHETLDMIEIMIKTDKLDKELWEKYRVIYCQDFIDSIKDAYHYRNNQIINRLEIINRIIKSFPTQETEFSTQETPDQSEFDEKTPQNEAFLPKNDQKSTKPVKSFPAQETELPAQETQLPAQENPTEPQNHELNPHKIRYNKKKEIYKERKIKILEHWNTKDIRNHTVEPKNGKRTLQNIVDTLTENYTLEDIEKAIDNYATILKSDLYWFNYNWNLAEFLVRGFENFKDWNIAQRNYIRDKRLLKDRFTQQDVEILTKGGEFQWENFQWDDTFGAYILKKTLSGVR